MDRDRRLSVVVGLFALGALVLFGASILTLTSNRGPWIPRYSLVAYFGNVQGLIEGAPVRLAGKDVGIVEGVTFGAFGDAKPPIQVSMRVDTSVRERLRTDSRAQIGTMGLLGDKYIELSMGSLESEILADGAEVPAITPPDLSEVMAKGTQALDGVAALAGNLNKVAAQFEESRGAAKIADSAKGVADIVAEVREGRGLLHSLIYDEYKGGGVESISRSLATLEDILREIARGDGLAHQLIYEPGSKQETVAEVTSAAKRLDSILARIDRGEGTLGLLVSDPALYQDLRALLGGANRSLIVRSLIRLSTGDGAADPAETEAP
jgi:phospholipid/cholesterol/gamma-HCH transport system substrate-binding protein